MLLLRVRKERLMAEAWVSVEEVATHLGVAKDSVYRWIEHKGLPAHKIGRLWKCQLSEVDAWGRAPAGCACSEGLRRRRAIQETQCQRHPLKPPLSGRSSEGGESCYPALTRAAVIRCHMWLEQS